MHTLDHNETVRCDLFDQKTTALKYYLLYPLINYVIWVLIGLIYTVDNDNDLDL